jgi:hypothetical protein
MNNQKTNTISSGFGVGSAGSKFANRNLNTTAKLGVGKEKLIGNIFIQIKTAKQF